MNTKHYDFIQKLVEWDIDHGTVDTVVPYAIGGKYSPDRRTIAYITIGPADLDTKNRPLVVTNKPRQGEIYLQVMDRSTRVVSLAVPAAVYLDYYTDGYYDIGMNFSPDGHFLAFLSHLEIKLDQTGWPVMPQPETLTEGGPFLYVLDMKTHKLAWSHPVLALPPTGSDSDLTIEKWLPNWSPKGNAFTYLDARGNLNLANLSTGINLPITNVVDGQPAAQWSQDDAYLAIQIPVKNGWKVGFLKVP